MDSWISSIQMVGVNSRNLATLKTDVTLFETMVKKLPREATWVAESGIKSASDIAVLRQSGYSGFLIGDAFLRSSLPHKACAKMARELQTLTTSP